MCQTLAEWWFILLIERPSALADMELASRGQVFVGNGFSTFTSTVYAPFHIPAHSCTSLTRKLVIQCISASRQGSRAKIHPLLVKPAFAFGSAFLSGPWSRILPSMYSLTLYFYNSRPRMYSSSELTSRC